ncbi:MAG: hypothetical protein PHZ03_00430 [Syntrophomonas sp.]|nr:hypothetical protein [Syntrophomonas sp.]
MQDSSRPESDFKLPVWKTASVSDNQPKYIRSPFSGNFGRFHRQIISFDETDANVNSKAGELDRPLVYVDQVESRMEVSSEITVPYELGENELINHVSGESNQPPIHGELLTLEVESEFEPGENELKNNIIGELNQALMPDKLPGEVELEMDSDYEATVVFEPCGNEHGLEVGLDMDIDIQNRIQALEERILRLESEIQRLEEINQSSKNRGIIRLDGSMMTSACGCNVCSVE